MKGRANIQALYDELTAPSAPFELREEAVLGERMTVFANRPRSLRGVIGQLTTLPVWFD